MYTSHVLVVVLEFSQLLVKLVRQAKNSVATELVLPFIAQASNRIIIQNINQKSTESNKKIN